MDDDIVFLGSSSPSVKLPSIRPAQRPVVGVSLHVEKNGSVDAHSLSFYRFSNPVAHIGRRSALDPVTVDSTTGASFRCAVVSRRHAKIAFSDSGHAYLIDLGSHHGTHVRSTADRLGRALKPETPTLLVDGDVITFGKAVGKGDECVRPIVARVELLHDARGLEPLQPLSLPSSSPASSKVSSGRYGVRTSSSSSSDESAANDGYSDIEEIPPPVQSAALSANLSPSPSQAQSQPSQTSCSQYPLPFKFKHITALKRFLPPMDVLPQHAPWHSHFDHTQGYRHEKPALLAANFTPHPVHPVMPAVRLPPPANQLHSMTNFVERPLAHLSQLSQFFLNGRGASNVFGLNNAQATSEANVENVTDEPSSDPPADVSASITADVSPSISPPSLEVSEAYRNIMSFAAEREPTYPDPNDIYYDSVPKQPENEPCQEPPYSPTFMFQNSWEKIADGAGLNADAVVEGGESTPPIARMSWSLDSDSYSDSDSDSDFSSSSSRNSEREQREKAREEERGRESGSSRASSEPMELASRSSSVLHVDKGKGRATEVDVEADEGGEVDMDIEVDAEASVDLDGMRKRVDKTTRSAIHRIEEAVARLEADLTIHRGQTKATLARHTNQMEVFDGRIREVDAECGVLCVRVETLGERVGVVEMDVTSATEASFNAIEAEAEKERAIEDARMEGVHAVQALIAEAQDELHALKALRVEAEAHAAAAVRQQQEQEQPPVLPSLKRKRDDSDEDAAADVDEAVHEHMPAARLKAAATTDARETEKDIDVAMDANSLPFATSTSGFDSSATTSSMPTLTLTSPDGVTGPVLLSLPPTIARRDDALPPPRKRARRIAGLMARTATAVGVGAVVTWTALAFS